MASLFTSTFTRAGQSAVLCLCLGAVACQDRQESALHDLTTRGFPFTVDAYLRAAEAGDLEGIRLYHEAGMSPFVTDDQGAEAIHYAVRGGKSKVVDELITCDVPPDTPTPFGRSPIMLAAENGDAETLEVLIAGGSNVIDQDEAGWSPLTLAANGQYADAILVLGPRSRPHLDDALHIAALCGDVESTGILIGFGADVLGAAEDGQTPLMRAAIGGHHDVIRALLSAGASRFTLNPEGRCAAELARISNRPDLALLLQSPPEPPPTPERWLGVGMPPEVIAAYETVPHNPLQSFEFPSAHLGPQRLLGLEIEDAIFTRRKPIRMLDYRESRLPVELLSIDTLQQTASVKIIGGPNEPLTVAKGAEIPGTGLRLLKMQQRYIRPNGEGSFPVDAASIQVEEVASPQSVHQVVKGHAASAAKTYALLNIEGENELFDARVGDRFTAGTTVYELAQIRPDHLVIEDLAAERRITVLRESAGSTARLVRR